MWTQAHLFVQIAAKEREPLLTAQRRVAARLLGVCSLDEEVLGGQIGEGREAYGFKDPMPRPTPEQIDASLDADGNGWLLWLRYEQPLDRFSAQPLNTRQRIFGATIDGVPLNPSPPTSHKAMMQPHKKLLRRGFPWRKSGEEGLAFVAVARDAETHRSAVETFAKGGDALAKWATPISGGLYFLPGRIA
jgi:putative iron-dependent peroxidase